MMDMMNMGGGASGSMNSSMGMNMNMPGMGGQMSANMPGMYDPSMMSGMANHGTAVGGSGFGGIFGGIINLTMELLALFMVIGLVVGTVVLIKRFVIDGDLLVSNYKTACTKCGTVLDKTWNCCPRCGTQRVNQAASTVVS